MKVEEIKKLADKYYEEMVEIRRHLHRNPELSFQEHETTAYIIEKLMELGIHVDRPLDTGCVGVLKGGKESDRVIGLRADIDALPMEEAGEHKKTFLSENRGVSHCCGHDGHTANLLGTAHILKQLQDEIEGTVLLIFQPGEEKLPGGGRLLCETGYLQEKGLDVIYGLHTYSYGSPGEISVRKGPLMARPDEFEIDIIGNGGHAAAPQKTVDPIVVAAQVVMAIQTIVSRNIDPTDSAVITIGKIAGGTAHNVIPEKVSMIGTVRTLSQEQSDFIRSRMEQTVKGITASAGADYRFEFNKGYPAVVNTDWATDNLIGAAAEIIGEEQIEILNKPVMAGEDFAFYQQHFPGVFFFLGSGSEQSGSVYSWHHPRYNIDEECFKTGAALMASLVFQPAQDNGS